MVINMLKSMTGYGRHESIIDGKEIMVEIKSVNSRYADFNIKVPRYYGFLEDRVRDFVQAHIQRGKTDIYISVQEKEEEQKTVHLNTALAGSYKAALDELKNTYNLSDDVTVSTLASFTDIFDIERKEIDIEALWETVKKGLTMAIADFMIMREREGQRLQSGLLERSDYLIKVLSEIEELAPQTAADYKNKITERITELLNGINIDEGRLLTEVAIFADKISIDEEIIRLKSHIEEMKILLTSSQPIGRKMDFLLQEMNREINTIGSKSNNINISRSVVELKSELEKLREQIQNIE